MSHICKHRGAGITGSGRLAIPSGFYHVHLDLSKHQAVGVSGYKAIDAA